MTPRTPALAAARRLPVPLETHEQQTLAAWARLLEGRYPALADLYAIPNGAHKSRSAAARFQREGLKSGVPDMHLPHARGGYHSLYLELKRVKGGVVSPEQRDWHARLRAAGHRVEVCRGAREAAAILLDYLGAAGAVPLPI